MRNYPASNHNVVIAQKGPWGEDSSWEGNNNSPKFEDTFNAAKEKIRQMAKNKGSGKNNDGNFRQLIFFGVIAVFIMWLLSGFYRVEPDEQGVVTRFGKFVRLEQPGLNYHLPSPIEEVLTPRVTVMHRLDSGFKPVTVGYSDREVVSEEGHMLTGDQNILHINFSVLWVIKDARSFVFNIRGTPDTVKIAAESAVREIIARWPLESALTHGRFKIAEETRVLLQRILDGYDAGVDVVKVELQDVNPPAEVIDAFRDVQSANADKDRLHNEGLAYAQDVLPKAYAERARILQDATAYKAEIIAAAKGNAQRFLDMQKQYALAPDITIKNMYFSIIGEVFKNSPKVIIDPSLMTKGGVLPYLPLPEIRGKI